MGRSARGEERVGGHFGYLHRQLILVAVFLGVQGSTVEPAFGITIPAQFIGRLYTEALGRAPDQGGWAEYTQSWRWTAGCNVIALRDVAQSIYGSPEYLANYGGDNRRAKIITLYRGLLAREPDAGGMQWYLGVDMSTSQGMRDVVATIAGSDEFQALVQSTCAPGPYFWMGTPSPLDAAAGNTISGLALQQELNNLGADYPMPRTYSLPQYSVVMAMATITVPCNVTLETAGSPKPNRYALMARIVRDFRAPAADSSTGFRQSPVIRVCGGLQSVWVDGQRAHNPYISDAMSAAEPTVVVEPQLLASQPASPTGLPKVVDSRLTDASGSSNIYVGRNNYICNRFTNAATGPDDRPINITRNLITDYAGKHAPGTTDGITNFCSNVEIAENDIVDVTDVAVVLFRVPPGPSGTAQHSKVHHNNIVQTGNSAWAAIALDGMNADGKKWWSFSGCEVYSNVFWADTTGPATSPTFSSSTQGTERISPHFVIAIAIGTRPWFGDAGPGSPGSTTIKHPNVHDNGTGTLSANATMGIAIHGARAPTGLETLYSCCPALFKPALDPLQVLDGRRASQVVLVLADATIAGVVALTL